MATSSSQSFHLLQLQPFFSLCCSPILGLVLVTWPWPLLWNCPFGVCQKSSLSLCAVSHSWKFTRPWTITKKSDNFSLPHVGLVSLMLAFHPDLKSFLCNPVSVSRAWCCCLSRIPWSKWANKQNVDPEASARQENFKSRFLWLQVYLSLKLSYYNIRLSKILKAIKYL